MKSVKSINEVFLLTVVTALVGSYVYQFFGLNHCDYYVSLLFSQFILILPTAIYILKNKLSVKELFRINKIKTGTVFWLILFAFLSMPLMQEINLISMLFAKNVITDKMSAITQGKPFLFSLFLIAGVPAILEESVYRGSFFHTYSRQSPRKAILFSGLLFGLMHLNFNQFSYAFIMGVIFCLIIEATNSIVSSMIMHFIINGTSVMMLYVTPYFEKLISNMCGTDYADRMFQDVNTVSTKALLIPILFYGVIALFTTTLAVLVFIAIAKYQGRWEYIKVLFTKKQKRIADNNERILSAPLMLGMAICILYMFLIEFA